MDLWKIKEMEWNEVSLEVNTFSLFILAIEITLHTSNKTIPDTLYINFQANREQKLYRHKRTGLCNELRKLLFLPPDIVSTDLSGLCPLRQGHRI
jgi:hypothetical protein